MDLTSISVVQGGAAGLVALIVLMVLTGKLVTRSALEDARADRDARLAEARAEIAQWQAAARTTMETNSVQAGQIEQLMEVARTAEHLIRALPHVDPPHARQIVEVQQHVADEP